MLKQIHPLMPNIFLTKVILDRYNSNIALSIWRPFKNERFSLTVYGTRQNYYIVFIRQKVYCPYPHINGLKHRSDKYIEDNQNEF